MLAYLAAEAGERFGSIKRLRMKLQTLGFIGHMHESERKRRRYSATASLVGAAGLPVFAMIMPAVLMSRSYVPGVLYAHPVFLQRWKSTALKTVRAKMQRGTRVYHLDFTGHGRCNQSVGGKSCTVDYHVPSLMLKASVLEDSDRKSVSGRGEAKSCDFSQCATHRRN